MKMRTEYNPSDYAPSLVFVRIYATILKTITTQHKSSGDNSMRILDLDMDYRKVFGKEYIENDYIFKNPDGSLYRPDSLTRTFQRVLKRKGYEHIRLHDLRHATATILYAKGWKVLEMQRWMRHSDIKTTLAIYTHLTNEQVVESSKSLNGLFSVNAN